MLYKISFLKSNKISAQESFQIMWVQSKHIIFFILFLIIWFNSFLCESVCFENGCVIERDELRWYPMGLTVTQEGCTPKENTEGSPQFRSVSSALWGQKLIFPVCLEVCRYMCSNIYCLCAVKLLAFFLKKI